MTKLFKNKDVGHKTLCIQAFCNRRNHGVEKPVFGLVNGFSMRLPTICVSKGMLLLESTVEYKYLETIFCCFKNKDLNYINSKLNTIFFWFNSS